MATSCLEFWFTFVVLSGHGNRTEAFLLGKKNIILDLNSTLRSRMLNYFWPYLHSLWKYGLTRLNYHWNHVKTRNSNDDPSWRRGLTLKPTDDVLLCNIQRLQSLRNTFGNVVYGLCPVSISTSGAAMAPVTNRQSARVHTERREVREEVETARGLSLRVCRVWKRPHRTDGDQTGDSQVLHVLTSLCFPRSLNLQPCSKWMRETFFTLSAKTLKYHYYWLILSLFKNAHVTRKKS